MKNIKLLSLLTGISMLFFGVGVLIVMPEFVALYSGFGVDLPLLTKVVIATYQYWLLLLIVPVSIYIIVLNESELSIRAETVFQAALISILIFCCLILPLVVVSMYLPIYQMGVVVE